MNKEVTLNSNCVATIIPAGDQVTLAEGATYTIAQSTGELSNASRCHWYVSGRGRPTLGIGREIKEEVLQADQAEESTGPFEEKQVWDALRGCFDPGNSCQYCRSWPYL